MKPRTDRVATISRRALLGGLLAPAALAAPARAQAADAIVHGSPGPLAGDAVTHDWPFFLGPTHDAVSTETRLSRALPPPLVWELAKGSGYASPAVAGDRLVFLHRIGGHETVDCLHPETGARRWTFRYPSAYEDRYGYNNGPRSSPVIDPARARVYAMGAEAVLHCLALASGDVVWRRDLRREFGVRQDFFGVSSTPLIEGDLLIVNAGAPDGGCVIAFDAASGREVWRAGTWGPSYASPVPGVVHGARRVFVFAGGESRPPSGGLLSIDPANGAVDFEFPFRSRTYESVNASCPVVFDDRVFISASYRAGGALVAVRPDFTHEVAWTTREFALHYNTPIHQGGYLYGFDGRNMGDSSLACVDAASGAGGVARGAHVDGDVRDRRAPRPADPGHRPRVAAGRRRPVPLPRRARPPALAGPDAARLPPGLARMALRRPRVVGAPGAQPRSPLRRAERPRPHPGNAAAAPLLRPPRVIPRDYRTSSTRWVSLRRAPAMMPCMPMFPSWQAYSKSGPSVRRSGIIMVHGRA